MTAAIMALSIGAVLGVPGLSGFVGQSLIVMGAFVWRPLATLAVGASALLVTHSLFGAFGRLFLGTPEDEPSLSPKEGELSLRDRTLLIPLVALMVVIGFYPKPFLDRMRPAAARLIERPSPNEGPVVAAPTPAPAQPPVAAPTPAIPDQGAEEKK